MLPNVMIFVFVFKLISGNFTDVSELDISFENDTSLYDDIIDGGAGDMPKLLFVHVVCLISN